jgi:hypothetical protein
MSGGVPSKVIRASAASLLLASVLLGSLCAHAADSAGWRASPSGSEALPERLRTLSPEALTVQIYARLEQALRESGYPEVEVRLTDVRTIFPENFDAVTIRDVLTLDPPRRLEMVPESRQLSIRLQDSSVYTFELLRHLEAEWEPTPPDATPEQRAWNPTLATAFDPLTQTNPLPVPLALTAYRVRVHLGDEDRTWKAYTIWNEWPPRDRLSIDVQDHGFEGSPVLEPTFVTRPYMTRAEMDRLARAIPVWRLAAEAASPPVPIQP